MVSLIYFELWNHGFSDVCIESLLSLIHLLVTILPHRFSELGMGKYRSTCARDGFVNTTHRGKSRQFNLSLSSRYCRILYCFYNHRLTQFFWNSLWKQNTTLCPSKQLFYSYSSLAQCSLPLNYNRSAIIKINDAISVSANLLLTLIRRGREKCLYFCLNLFSSVLFSLLAAGMTRLKHSRNKITLNSEQL